MSSRTVYVIQHAAVETPGLIEEVLREQGIGIQYVQPFRGDAVPQRLGDRASLVVMGGPMSVYEAQRYLFLADELRLIGSALKEARPVLGVCLGSQLLAAALGGTVRKGRQKEIGWHSVSLPEATVRDEFFCELPPSFTAFHWHGDVFDLPAQAVSLTCSKLTDCQAFRYGPSALGLLFHLEVNEQIIRGMVTAFQNELRDAGLSEREILEGIRVHLDSLQRVGRVVFGRWAQLVKDLG